MPVLQYYRWPALNEHAIERLVERARAAVPGLRAIENEWCFNVESASGAPDAAALAWLLVAAGTDDIAAGRVDLSSPTRPVTTAPLR